LAKVVDAAQDILNAERGTVFLYDAQADVLISRVATGSGELRIPASRGFAGECVKTRQIVSVPDAYADPRFNPDVDKSTGYKTRCILTIPLIGHDDAMVGVLQVLNKRTGVFGDDDVDVATALAASCAVAIQRMRLLIDLLAKQRMERELEVARDIQTRVLPKTMPSLPGYEVAGWSRAADQTGGDIFDVIAKDGTVMLLLGDATGHGIGPALSVTQVRAMLRIAVRLGAGLDDAFRHINDQLADDLSSNRFVTAFLGVLDTASHRLTYHAGGPRLERRDVLSDRHDPSDGDDADREADRGARFRRRAGRRRRRDHRRHLRVRKRRREDVRRTARRPADPRGGRILGRQDPDAHRRRGHDLRRRRPSKRRHDARDPQAPSVLRRGDTPLFRRRRQSVEPSRKRGVSPRLRTEAPAPHAPRAP